MTYYPIGTVITLIGGNRPLMIYGRKQQQENTGIIWDYVACLYPEGNVTDNETVFFQHDEIDTVLFRGYKCAAETQMLDIINKSA